MGTPRFNGIQAASAFGPALAKDQFTGATILLVSDSRLDGAATRDDHVPRCFQLHEIAMSIDFSYSRSEAIWR
jgi:hypothetical protein